MSYLFLKVQNDWNNNKILLAGNKFTPVIPEHSQKTKKKEKN